MTASGEDDGVTALELPRPLPTGGNLFTLTGSTRWIVVGLSLVLAAAAFLLVDDVRVRWTLIVLSPLGAAASVVDWRTRRIPTTLAAAAGVVTLCACIVLAVFDRTWLPLMTGIGAGAATGIFYLTLWRLAGLGPGDVRLATALAPITGALGWHAVVTFIVATHLLAAPFALWALTRHQRDIPLGPAIVGGLYFAVGLAPMT